MLSHITWRNELPHPVVREEAGDEEEPHRAAGPAELCPEAPRGERISKLLEQHPTAVLKGMSSVRSVPVLSGGSGYERPQSTTNATGPPQSPVLRFRVARLWHPDQREGSPNTTAMPFTRTTTATPLRSGRVTSQIGR